MGEGSQGITPRLATAVSGNNLKRVAGGQGVFNLAMASEKQLATAITVWITFENEGL